MPRSGGNTKGKRRRLAAGALFVAALGGALSLGLARGEDLALDLDRLPIYAVERAGGGLTVWIASPDLY